MSYGINIFGVRLITRVLILLIISLALGRVFLEPQWVFVQIVLLAAIAILTWDIHRLVSSTNKRLNSFLDSVYHNEFNSLLDDGTKGAGFSQLVQRFKRLNHKWEKSEDKRIKQTLLFEQILQMQRVGLAVIDHKRTVLFQNSSFYSLLGLPAFKNLDQVKATYTKMYNAILGLEDHQMLRLSPEDFNHGFSEELIITKSQSATDEDIQVYLVQQFEEHLLHRETQEWMNLIKILGHEIMNKVSPIISMSEFLASEMSKDYSNTIEKIHHQSLSLMKLADGYRSLLQVQAPVKQRFYWSDFFKKMKEKQDKLDITLNGDALEMPVMADLSQLEQVFDNIIINSVQAGASRLEVQVLARGLNYIVFITDNGSGIAPELYSKIFLPLFSSKEEGSGIGLSLARQILWKHNGGISLEKSDTGARFKVRIPSEL
ncbi:HAMP domain-containing histidine kinase [bacterium]|nr:HAMP domain-containing histidine kinase [bacterium]